MEDNEVPMLIWLKYVGKSWLDVCNDVSDDIIKTTTIK